MANRGILVLGCCLFIALGSAKVFAGPGDENAKTPSPQAHGQAVSGLGSRQSIAPVGLTHQGAVDRKVLQGLKGSIEVPFFPMQSAAVQEQTATPSQTNQTSSESGSVKKKSSKLKWILIGAAGAAVGGVLAMQGGEPSGMTTNPTPTVTVGPPTVIPPQ